MKRSALRKLLPGSAELVIAHAVWRGQRGRGPSMSYINERDPRKALKLAQSVVKAAGQAARLSQVVSKVLQANGKTYKNMTNAEFRMAVREIIRTASSEEEVQRRVRDELDYPYGLALHTSVPEDSIGREARELVRGLGGLVMRNGAMAMAMMHGRDGKTIHA